MRHRRSHPSKKHLHGSIVSELFTMLMHVFVHATIEDDDSCASLTHISSCGHVVFQHIKRSVSTISSEVVKEHYMVTAQGLHDLLL